MKKQYHRNRGIIGSDYNICSSLNKSHHTVSVCNFNIIIPEQSKVNCNSISICTENSNLI